MFGFVFALFLYASCNNAYSRYERGTLAHFENNLDFKATHEI